MKVTLCILGLIALGSAAPQPRKLFHEHFEDFQDVIMEEAGEKLAQLAGLYLQFDEFLAGLNYVATKNFKDLVIEMESLPEFKAVVDFLEKDNIDITYFLDIFNEMLDSINDQDLKARQEASGKDIDSFIQDSITLFPKEKLAALFDEKMAEDEEFKTAITNLYSDEWIQILDALWENPTFQSEVQTLNENGVNVRSIMQEIVAIFGQN